MSAEIVREQRIDGITFGAVDGHGLCRDVDLAAFLEYAKPRDVRQLIKRHDGSPSFGVVCVRRTVQRTQMPTGGVREVEVDEYWLTRKQAIQIAAKSDTARADELLSDVVDRFLAYEAGLRESDRIYLYLRDVPDERWEMLFKRKVADAIAQLSGKRIDWSRGFPVYLCARVGQIYSMILGSAVYDVMRENKAADRARGLRMHQRLTPEARQLMAVELGVVESFALQCASDDELWARLSSRYEGTPFQLSFSSPPRLDS